MKKICLGFTAILLITSGLSAQQNPLVDAQWVQKRMEKGDLVIFHIGREEDYKKEHIEGAIYMEPSEYTYQDDVRVFDLPTDQELKELFESKGLSNDKDVVIYTPKNWIPLVTRLYFTLDYLGHGGKTYILDGGLVAWKALEGNISSEIPKLETGTFEIKPNMNFLASKDEVLGSIEDEKVDIIDCRAQVYYTAIEATHGARNGRIPGAKTIPYTTLYQETDIGAYKFKTLDELSKIFKGQKLKKDGSIVLYCHIGMQLTVIYTAAKMLGYQDVKMYDGSFREWGPDESLPVEVD